MRLKFGLTLVCCAGTLAVIAAQPASAATEFGDGCTGTKTSETGGAVTFFNLAAPGNPLPVAAPSAGVVTKLKVNSAVAGAIQETIRVLRLNPATKTTTGVGESSVTVAPGLNVYDARLTVQQGDLLGASGVGEEGALVYCEVPGEEALYGATLGAGGPYAETSGEARIAVSAIVEADADGDGYGDETQDRCPQVAAVQVECPPVSLDAAAIAQKGKVVVYVTAASTAPVTVAGTGKAGKTKVKLKKVTKNAEAGKLTRFTLKLPKAAKKGLAAGKTLKLTITTSATNTIGQVSKDVSKLKLKG